MVTLKQIAAMAGVSRGTVDRVVNHRGGVNEDTARKIQAIIDSVGYVPNSIGRTLAKSRKNFRLGFLIFQSTSANPFFTDVLRGVEQAARELRDFGVTVETASCGMKDTTGREQVECIEALVRAGVQGLAVTPFNHPRVAEKLRDLTARGIPVINVNSDLEHSGRLCYIGSDYRKAGETAGGLMGLFHRGGGQIGIVTGSPLVVCHTERESGFRKILAERYPKLAVVAREVNQDDDFISYAVTCGMLEAHPELTGLYIAAGGVYGACRAVEAMRREDRPVIVSHDKAENTLEMLRKGVITATIGQEAFRQGCEPLQILYDYLARGIAPGADAVYTRLDICIRENVDEGAEYLSTER